MAASLAVGVLAVPGTYQAKAEDLSPAPSETPIQTTAVPTGTPVQTPLISAVPATTTGVPVLVSVPPTQHPKVTAEPKATVKPKKAYGDQLKLNNEIKLNKTVSMTRKAYYKDKYFYPKGLKDTVKCKITCKRKSIGNKYQVTYMAKYHLLKNPKISNVQTNANWLKTMAQPTSLYTVFDYQTGKTLEIKNKLGVKVKYYNTKAKFYPKQYYHFIGAAAQWNPGEYWWHKAKEWTWKFTVTYPKDCKDIVVGIGFANMDGKKSDNGYWKGKYAYGKTNFYKYGKKTMSYMRLDQ